MKLDKLSSLSLVLKSMILIFLLQVNITAGQSQTSKNEKHEVKEALRLETQYCYQRDIEKWANQWLHEPFVMKSYVRDGKYSEQLGWPVILKSAKD